MTGRRWGAEQGRTVGTGRGWRDAALVPSLVAVGAMVAIISSLGAPADPDDSPPRTMVSLSTAQWLLTAALLTGALVTPVLGRLADGTHQRDVIVLALGVVVLGSVLAAVSNSFRAPRLSAAASRGGPRPPGR